MKYNIKVFVSNRHVHLTKETYELLFDHELTKKKDLNQGGEFAANETVTIKNGEKIIENVRIVGPLRNYNQIEISKKDARLLDVNPPVRRSGNLDNTPSITIETSKGSVTTNGLILANRHIHMSPEEALKNGIIDGQKVRILVPGDKSGEMDAEIKITPNGASELHIDTDDANAFLIENNDDLIMEI